MTGPSKIKRVVTTDDPNIDEFNSLNADLRNEKAFMRQAREALPGQVAAAVQPVLTEAQAARARAEDAAASAIETAGLDGVVTTEAELAGKPAGHYRAGLNYVTWDGNAVTARSEVLPSLTRVQDVAAGAERARLLAVLATAFDSPTTDNPRAPTQAEQDAWAAAFPGQPIRGSRTAAEGGRQPLGWQGGVWALDGEATASARRVAGIAARVEDVATIRATRDALAAESVNPGTARLLADEFGLLTVTPDDGTPIDNGLTFRTANGLLAKRKQLDNGWVDAELYGVDTTGGTDETALLQSMVDDVIVRLPSAPHRSGQGIRIATGLQIGAQGGLWGANHVHGRCVLLAERTDGGPVIELAEIRDDYAGHRANGEGQADAFFKMAIQDLTIRGTGKAQDAIGVRLRNSTQRISHVMCQLIGKGFVFTSFSNYLNELEYVVATFCNVGIEFQNAKGGNSNSGENLGFYKAFVIGNNIGIVIEDGWSVRMISPSLDYNTNQIRFVVQEKSATPHVLLVTPHVEWDSGQPFLMNNYGNRGGKVLIPDGGVFLDTSTGGGQVNTRRPDFLIDPGCGPGHVVVIRDAEDGGHLNIAHVTGLADLAYYIPGTSDYNDSGVRWELKIRVTHNPTANAPSVVTLHTGYTDPPVEVAESYRPPNHIPGVRETLTLRVESGMYWRVNATNAAISVERLLVP